VVGGGLEDGGGARTPSEVLGGRVTLHQLVRINATLGWRAFSGRDPGHGRVVDGQVVVGLGFDQLVGALVAPVVATVGRAPRRIRQNWKERVFF
jgi:hypothetical protein